MKNYEVKKKNQPAATMQKNWFNKERPNHYHSKSNPKLEIYFWYSETRRRLQKEPSSVA